MRVIYFFLIITMTLPLFPVRAEGPGVVISEIKIGGSESAKDEFIELYNPSESAVDLAGWSLKKTTAGGSESNLVSAGAFAGEIPAGGYFLVVHPDHAGNYDEDLFYSGASYSIAADNTVTLYDAEENPVDIVGYGEATVFEDSPAANPEPGQSITRGTGGVDSGDNQADFSLTDNPTPGEAPAGSGGGEGTGDDETTETVITTAPAAPSQFEQNRFDYSDDVAISEIMPNPAGSDREAEYVEIRNRGDKAVNLRGWRLGDSTDREHEFGEDDILWPREYILVYRADSGIALNNSGDTVRLYQPEEARAYEKLDYARAREGESYNCQPDSDGIWGCLWSLTPTPGKTNRVEYPNHPPQVDFSFPAEARPGRPVFFDASDTLDPENDPLAYRWDFGDGHVNDLLLPEHTYWQSGQYPVTLTVSDGKNEVVLVREITITDAEEPADESEEAVVIKGEANWPAVVISEFMPDPEGSDRDGEYIELLNRDSRMIDLRGWVLDDEEDGSRPYTFKGNTPVAPGERLTVRRPESNIALNNTADKVRLIAPDGTVIDEIAYEATNEGEAFARGQNTRWFPTMAATPDEPNEIRLGDELVMNYRDPLPAQPLTFYADIRPDDLVINTDPERIRRLEAGDRVRLKGTVTVKPGILNSRFFYIQDAGGIQIYSYDQDFPELSVGDLVEVTGELSFAYDEPRVKTGNADDITLISSGVEPEPEPVSCELVGDPVLGQLVAVKGEVVDKTGNSIYLDDGTAEVRVFLPDRAGIDSGRVKTGDTLEVAGIINRTRSGLRLLPRGPEDLAANSYSPDPAGQVLGESAESEWTLPPRDPRSTLIYYYLAAAMALIIVGGIVIYRLRQNNKTEPEIQRATMKIDEEI